MCIRQECKSISLDIKAIKQQMLQLRKAASEPEQCSQDQMDEQNGELSQDVRNIQHVPNKTIEPKNMCQVYQN